MNNKDNSNKNFNEVEQNCENKDKLQSKYTKQVKGQDSPCSSTNCERTEEAPNFSRKSATHEKQKGFSTVRFT
jgi:hypothetical protein